MRTIALLLICASLSLFESSHAAAQLRDSGEINVRIRNEGLAHSEIMHTVHILADVHGPRLTGSPQEKAAAEWALKRMRSWGLQNGHLEPWNFGHSGWSNERASGYIVLPIRSQLHFKVAAWTPGTNGVVRARTVTIDPPQTTTAEQLARYMDSVRVHVQGKIVMVGQGSAAAESDPPMYRFDKKTIAEIFRPEARAKEPDPQADSNLLTSAQINERIDNFLIAAGALLRVNNARGQHGSINAPRNGTYDVTKALPTVALSNEDYSRIARISADGTPATLEFDIQNLSHPAGTTSYNTIAEIPGSDKKDEIVMIGAHLDSWHVATGAIDDGVGSAIMMEATRILLALRLHPRRTIRIALWTGEEQYLLGSQHYVAQHFGTAENPKPEFSKLAAYLNLDSGTGRIRGMNIFGPPESAKALHAALTPFSDMGVEGVVAHGTRRLGSTDATTFSRAGLPAIGIIQDPLGYGAIAHTNLDTFEQVVESEARKAAIVVAAVIFDLATRDGMLPRFTQADMPRPDGPAPALRPVQTK